ncbi:MAG: hypothetical protein U1E76_05565 [Planctomycetota bacterium]
MSLFLMVRFSKGGAVALPEAAGTVCHLYRDNPCRAFAVLHGDSRFAGASRRPLHGLASNGKPDARVHC